MWKMTFCVCWRKIKLFIFMLLSLMQQLSSAAVAVAVVVSTATLTWWSLNDKKVLSLTHSNRLKWQELKCHFTICCRKKGARDSKQRTEDNLRMTFLEANRNPSLLSLLPIRKSRIWSTIRLDRCSNEEWQWGEKVLVSVKEASESKSSLSRRQLFLKPKENTYVISHHHHASCKTFTKDSRPEPWWPGSQRYTDQTSAESEGFSDGALQGAGHLRLPADGADHT